MYNVLIGMQLMFQVITLKCLDNKITNNNKWLDQNSY